MRRSVPVPQKQRIRNKESAGREDVDAEQHVEAVREQELARLQQENTRLLDELESIYQQFIMLKGETDISYAQLRARNQELENKIEELERAYTELGEAENQLIHSERLAAMGQLAASIVHELSSPLTVINGYIDLLLIRSPLSNEERRILQIARQHAESMNKLVREILSFSHKQITPFGAVNVNELMDYVVAFLGKFLEKHTFTINKSLASDLPSIVGSAQQIQQVFVNMITNAADAMEGKGALSIETKSMDSAAVVEFSNRSDVSGILSAGDIQTLCGKYEQFVVIRFQDDGPGMPSETLVDIFSPFFTTKTADKGTGLGLSICRTIIERHDGNIMVSSVVDEGTVFTVLLPVRSDGNVSNDTI